MTGAFRFLSQRYSVLFYPPPAVLLHTRWVPETIITVLLLASSRFGLIVWYVLPNVDYSTQCSIITISTMLRNTKHPGVQRRLGYRCGITRCKPSLSLHPTLKSVWHLRLTIYTQEKRNWNIQHCEVPYENSFNNVVNGGRARARSIISDHPNFHYSLHQAEQRQQWWQSRAMFLPTPVGCLSIDRIDHLHLFVTSNNTNVLQDIC